MTALGMAFSCEMDERMDHLFHRVFLGNKMSVGFISRTNFVQKLFESRASGKMRWLRLCRSAVHLTCTCTSMH